MSHPVRQRESQKRATFGRTLKNAIALNGDFYERAQNTPKNQRIAMTIVILAAISQAIGSGVIALINRATLPGFVLGILVGGFSVVVGYYFWTLTIWQVGQWLKRQTIPYRELLIPIGFAYAPQVFNFLTLIPLLGQPIALVLAAWSLLAVIVAVRQGLDISPVRSAVICLLGWVPLQVAIGSLQVVNQTVGR